MCSTASSHLVRLTLTNIRIAGAAMDFILNSPQLLKDVTPAQLAGLRETRDLFETLNSENSVLDTLEG